PARHRAVGAVVHVPHLHPGRVPVLEPRHPGVGLGGGPAGAARRHTAPDDRRPGRVPGQAFPLEPESAPVRRSRAALSSEPSKGSEPPAMSSGGGAAYALRALSSAAFPRGEGVQRLGSSMTSVAIDADTRAGWGWVRSARFDQALILGTTGTALLAGLGVVVRPALLPLMLVLHVLLLGRPPNLAPYPRLAPGRARFSPPRLLVR